MGTQVERMDSERLQVLELGQAQGRSESTGKEELGKARVPERRGARAFRDSEAREEEAPFR